MTGHVPQAKLNQQLLMLLRDVCHHPGCGNRLGFDGVTKAVKLPPGTRIDRYGYPGGKFASPEKMPIPQRSLAPGTTAKPYNVYEVLKPLDARAGKIAPWFGEPGGGTQFEFSKSIQELIDEGFIRKVN